MNQTMLTKVNVRPIVRLNKYIQSYLITIFKTLLSKPFLLLFAFLMGWNVGFGQVTMTTTGSHSQNFNTLATSGTTNTWSNNSTILNWYSQRTGTGTSYAADAGAGTGGNLYSYGTSTNSERALGSIGSSNAAAGSFAHGVLLRNTSGSILTDIKVSYTLEQWRNGGNTTANTITFWYKTSSSSFTSLNPNSNTGWIQVTGLSLSSPINSSTGASLDGNATANKVALSNISIPSLSLANNDYIMLKWEDPDHTGTDHGLAIDDITISWTVPSTVTFNANGGSGTMTDQTASSAANLTSNTFTRTGYTFAGWNTAANGTGTSYADGASFPFSANTTLYAQWTANNLTVTFDSQGGSSVSNSSTTTGGSVSNPGNPTKSGYVFNGWYTASSGGAAISFPYSHGQTADFTLYAQWSAASSPTLTSTTLASALSCTYGTASSGVGFTASGSNLTGNITATAQSGYEVSSDNNSFSSSVSIASGATVYVRFAATQAVGSYNNATAVVLSSSGATDVNLSTLASGNTVAQKPLTVTGLTAQNKVYDGLTTATATGTASLSGVVGADVVSLSGTPSYAFGTATVGTGKTVTTSGYALTGANAANYTLTQPSLTADITARTLTITANDVTKFSGATLTGGAGSTAFTSSGLQNGETIGTVTITYGNGSAAGDPIGTYSGQVTPSAATSGTFTASNYTINYVVGAITVVEMPIIIAGWDFTGLTNYGSSPQLPLTVDPNVSIGGLTRASGFGTGGTAASDAWGGTGNGTVTFTVKSNNGFILNLSQINSYNIRRSSSGSTTGQWAYSLDGTNFTNIGNPITWGTTTSSAGNNQSAIPLSGISELQNLISTTTVTFRLINTGGTTGTWYLNNFQSGDDFIIQGNVKSVPQLSTPTASSIGTTSATLGATVTSDGGYTITSRGTVYGTSASPTGNALAEGGTSVAAFSHSRAGLTPNTFYYFRGYAINSVGTGYSPDGTFTTIHNAPIVGSGSNASTSSIDANWSAPTGGSASFTYEIQVDDNNNFSSPEFTQSGVSSATTSISATGLTPNTTYYYRLRANNAGGSSDWSAISVGFATLAVVSPTLSVSALNGFGNVCLNETSSANSFTINGLALTTDDVIVSSLSGYTFSTTLAGPYTNSLTLSQAGGSYTQEVFVKFKPTAAQSYNGNIVVSGGGAASGVNVAASGTGTVGTLSLTTIAVSSLTYQGGISGGSGITASCGTISAKGVVYGLSSNPTLSSNSTNEGTGTSNYSSSIDLTSFSSGQVVYYRAYATTSNGLTSYGNELSLTVPLVPCSDLFISEYVEGSSSNKYVEIYNPTNTPVDLSNYALRLYSNGSLSITTQTTLSGTIQPFSTLVLNNSSANAFSGTSVNASAINFTGDDAIALAKNGINIDVFGQIGVDPGTSWSVNGVATVDKTLRRKFSVINGDANGSNAFDPSEQWEVFSIDNVIDLGKYYTPSANNQQFCSLSNPTLNALQASGINGLQMEWFNQLTSAAPLSSSASLSSAIYYVSQTGTGCESSRTAVTVTVDDLTYSANAVPGDFIWYGASSTNFTATDNWLTFNGTSIVPANTLPTSSTNVIIPSAQTCVLNQPSTGSNTNLVAKALTIESGATLTINSGTLTVYDDFHVNAGGTLSFGTSNTGKLAVRNGDFHILGSFLPGNGTVEMYNNTNHDHTINNYGSTTNNTFYNLNVTGDPASNYDMHLTNNINVTHNLYIETQKLDLNNFGIDLGTTGQLVFPTGTEEGDNAHPYEDPTNMGNGYIQATRVINGGVTINPGNLGLQFTTDPNKPMGSTVVKRYHKTYNLGIAPSGSTIWSIARSFEVTPTLNGGTGPNDYPLSSGGLEVDLLFHYFGSLMTYSSLPSNAEPNLKIWRRPTNGATWDEMGGAVYLNDDHVTIDNFAHFSEITLAPSAATALPIELVSFQANCKEDNTVAVTWTTASEHNTSHYVVEKSRDGINWSVFGQTAAAGNSTQLLNYEMIDSEKANGTTYYRLKQVDNDGLYEVFGPVSVNCNEATSTNDHIVTYPNPSDAGFYISLFTETMDGKGQLSIMDGSGRTVYSTSVNIQDGNNVFHIGDMNVAPGMYYIQVSNGTTTTDIVKHSLR